MEKRSCVLVVVLETKSCPLTSCNGSSEELHVLLGLNSHCVSSLWALLRALRTRATLQRRWEGTWALLSFRRSLLETYYLWL